MPLSANASNAVTLTYSGARSVQMVAGIQTRPAAFQDLQDFDRLGYSFRVIETCHGVLPCESGTDLKSFGCLGSSIGRAVDS